MKIISGGQTGADQGGLLAARDCGVETGGFAPKGWRTEAGPAPWLADYGLKQSYSFSYVARTRDNIISSDGTVVFGRKSPGSIQTFDYAFKVHKPVVVVTLLELTAEASKVADLVSWAKFGSMKTINVAGNRESVSPGIQEAVRKFMTEFLTLYA